MDGFNVFITGIGGQGSLLIGTILAEIAVEKGYNAIWVPIYGVEKRGGDATVTVIVSKDEIASPVLLKVDSMVVMHQRMWNKYNSKLRKGGLLITNSSIVRIDNPNEFVHMAVPATDIALELGNEVVANMVLLGAFIRATGYFSIEDVKNYIFRASRKKEFVDINIKALTKGYSYLEL